MCVVLQQMRADDARTVTPMSHDRMFSDRVPWSFVRGGAFFFFYYYYPRERGRLGAAGEEG